MSHEKTPPTLPTVVDEAGDSPNWVPVLGLALFALVSLLVAIRSAGKENDAQAAEDTVQPTAAATGEAGAERPAD